MGLKIKIPVNLISVSREVVDEVEKEMLATTIEIETDSKELTPVKSGRLRASIKSTNDKNNFLYTVFTPVEYASFVEFGTRYQKAQPFLFPSFFKNTRNLTKRIANIIFK